MKTSSVRLVVTNNNVLMNYVTTNKDRGRTLDIKTLKSALAIIIALCFDDCISFSVESMKTSSGSFSFREIKASGRL